jgi:hypothetical protein
MKGKVSGEHVGLEIVRGADDTGPVIWIDIDLRCDSRIGQ